MPLSRVMSDLLAALIVAGLVGCGQVPQPFSRDVADKAATPPPVAAASQGVTVLPAEGVDERTGTLIAELTARALQRHGILASATASNQRSLFLAANGTRQPDGALRLDWTLVRPDGTVLGEFTRPIDSDADLVRASETLAAWVDPRTGLEPDAGFRPVVMIAEVSGAPGDGNALLLRAVDRALSRAPVALVRRPVRDGHQVSGSVTLTERQNGLDHVVVSWQVTDAEGREIGVIDQANDVPAGSLDRSWGAVAMPIAEGAAEGIVALLRDAEKRRRQAAREARPDTLDR